MRTTRTRTASVLDTTLTRLIDDVRENGSSFLADDENLQHYKHHLSHLETASKIALLRECLCVRLPLPLLPEDLLQDIDTILARLHQHKIVTPTSSLLPSRTFQHDEHRATKIHLWRGDITTLTDVTAITNAANSQGLGCFQPTHRFIDNIIHVEAGPRLREECFQRMQARGKELQPGEVLVTGGHALFASSVMHTVGPQLKRGASPTETERRQLSKCYESILGALDLLPCEEDGSKSVALCCISTGLFAFPADEAAEIAVSTVTSWLQEHPSTTITDVIFNTFTESDTEIYSKLVGPCPTKTVSLTKSLQHSSLNLARDWLSSADAVLVTAGAGLSAAEGLDYHSRDLFEKNFPGCLKLGLTSLYSVFGFNGWPSEEHRWGYFFTHLNMVANWSNTPTYQTLIAWLKSFGQDTFVRTSNADGLFLANGWPKEQLSTPQGSYGYLQCLKNCRVDAVVPSAPLVANAMPHIDKATQKLLDSSKIPWCRFCGSKMSICVRAGSWFNQGPFQEGEAQWKAWKSWVLRKKKNLVILELGVGMNTPGVLRWPNEDLVMRSDGRVKLIRVGMGPEAMVPWEQEDEDLSTCIQDDIGRAIPLLLE
ncbi:phosphatase ous to the C-terminal domain of histone macroH2A1 [Fusarium agapanthi]|uniref:Phosphatase ous to the C-terminal domain of histone macroH2A1 n=1 Tax=Fusarium agapanthi TaxID=1803897 RepID=A0A9P5BBY1_9HYPO|nr:phosphatase ous to the C-terminal domain of histone macroH2A1 [Fusarium agapanthi]